MVVLLNFQIFFNTILGFENSEIKEIIDLLNYDVESAGFQLLTNKETTPGVPYSSKEDEEKMMKTRMISQIKIGNNDTFECFLKSLVWLEEKEQCDSSEVMFLRKLRDRLVLFVA